MIRTVPVPVATLRDFVETAKRVSPRGQADADALAALVQHGELLLRVPPAPNEIAA